MPPRENVARLSCPVWLWTLLPLLLAATLSIPLLTADAFTGDEPRSLLAAGVLRIGEPHSFQAVWNTIKGLSPEQALGWPMLLSLWGPVVGWSELAIRSLPFFAGLLALAWVYRTGRDFFSARAGLFATLLFSASVFLHAYMAHARAFTLVALFSTLCLWCYLRLTLLPRPSRWASAGLLLGAIGLFWSHYIGALLLPVLGLYHLLFAPRTASSPTIAHWKTLRWWWPVLLLILAALSATPQLSVFEIGVDRTVSNQGLHDRSLSGMEMLTLFLHHLSNGLVNPFPPDEALLIILPLALLLLSLRLRRADNRAGRLLALVSLMLLTLVVLGNAVFRSVPESRIRYLMPLWPMTALLIGAGLHHLAVQRRRLVAGLLAFWLLAGVQANLNPDFRYRLGFFQRKDFHHVAHYIRSRIDPADFLAVDYHAAKFDRRRIYLRTLGVSWGTVHRYLEDPYLEVRPSNAEHPYLWLLYRTKNRTGFPMADLYFELGRVLCERALDDRGFTLEHYALRSTENCPDVPARMEYEGGISLTAPEVVIAEGRLRLDAHIRSEDHTLLAYFTLAAHIIDPRTGQRVAQSDTGVGPGNIVPLRSEIDLGALSAGEYELRVGLYNWQTGARLPGRDVETGESGDVLTLQRFRVG